MRQNNTKNAKNEKEKKKQNNNRQTHKRSIQVIRHELELIC